MRLCQMHHLTQCRTFLGKKKFAIYCFAFSSVEEEEVLSSEEDVPFRDDLNDQSYDPKVERFVVLYERDWVVHM